jgi:hypothetical protein
MKRLQYTGQRSTARQAYELLNSPSARYSPRPWNQFKPDDTLWWVVPSTQWPAYKYGKYVFWRDGEKIQCGLVIEKGFGTTVQAAFPSVQKKGFLLEPDWMWNKMIKDMQSETAMQILGRIQESPICISINASLAQDPSDYDPFAPKMKVENIEFEFVDGGLKLISYDFSDGSLEMLQTVKSLSELAEALITNPAADWIWYDFFITLPFKRAEDNILDADAIDANQLLHILEPLEQWIGLNVEL